MAMECKFGAWCPVCNLRIEVGEQMEYLSIAHMFNNTAKAMCLHPGCYVEFVRDKKLHRVIKNAKVKKSKKQPIIIKSQLPKEKLPKKSSRDLTTKFDRVCYECVEDIPAGTRVKFLYAGHFHNGTGEHMYFHEACFKLFKGGVMLLDSKETVNLLKNSSLS